MSVGWGQDCPENMFWMDCGSMCEPTCSNPEPDPENGCPMVCIDGCFCNYGFIFLYDNYWDPNYNICIPIEDCNSNLNATLSLGEVDLFSQTIEINLENSAPVSGFQFLLSIIGGDSMHFVNVYGGSSEDAGFTVDIGPNNIVLGYSISANEIPAGSDVLTIVEYEGYDMGSICLFDAIITSGYSGNPPPLFDIEYGNCITPYILGDINMDQELNVLDIVIMVEIILENQIPDDYQIWAGDISQDGLINVIDVVMGIHCIVNDECEWVPDLVYGCMDPNCPEWNPSANMDDGSCCGAGLGCLYDDEAGCLSDANCLWIAECGQCVDEVSYLLGQYNVDFNFGMIENGECIIDTLMNPYPPSEAIINFSDSTFQYFDSHSEEISSYPEWEYHVPEATSVNACEEEGNEGDSYWYCGNWGYDYQNCEDFIWDQDCMNNGCTWETHFCMPTGGQPPCHYYTTESDCNSGNDCSWDFNQNMCYQQMEIEGMQCFGMDSYDCGQDPDCQLSSDMVDCSECDCGPDPYNNEPECVDICCGGSDEGGMPDCIMDCEYVQNEDNDIDSAYGVCLFIQDVYSYGMPDDCIVDCNDEYMYDQEGEFAGTIMIVSMSL